MDWPGAELGNSTAAPAAPPPTPLDWPGEPVTPETATYAKTGFSPGYTPVSTGGGLTIAAPSAKRPMIDVKVPDKLLGEAQVLDTGEAYYNDPATGKLAPTDADKHVVQWDPDKQRYQVFSAKTEQRPAPTDIIDALTGEGSRLGGILKSFSAMPAYEAIKEVPAITERMYTGKTYPDDPEKLGHAMMTFMQPGSLKGGEGIALGSGPVWPSFTRISKPVPPPAPVLSAAEQRFKAAADIGQPIPATLETPNWGYSAMTNAAGQLPGGAGVMAEEAHNLRKGLGDVATQVQEQLGMGSRPVAGEMARDSIVDWVQNRSKDIMDRAYGAVDPLVDQNATRELHATTDAAQDIIDRRANAKIPGQSGAVNFVQDAITTPGGLNYQGVKHLRSALGEMTSDQMVSQGITAQERDQIYGALTEDLKGTILDHGGPDALNAFERANDIAKSVFSRRSDLAKIVGIKGDAAPELVFDKIIQMASEKGGANLNRLLLARRAVGHEAWDEVASASIARMGRDANGNFSPDRFVTAYGNLSPTSRQVLFGSTWRSREPLAVTPRTRVQDPTMAQYTQLEGQAPTLRDSLDKIQKVSEAYHQRITEFANKSGTGGAVLGGLATWELAKGAAAAMTGTGSLLDPLKALGGLLGGKALAQFLSKPVTAKQVATYAAAKQAYDLKPNPVTKLIFNHADRVIRATLAQGLGPM